MSQDGRTRVFHEIFGSILSIVGTFRSIDVHFVRYLMVLALCVCLERQIQVEPHIVANSMEISMHLCFLHLIQAAMITTTM